MFCVVCLHAWKLCECERECSSFTIKLRVFWMHLVLIPKIKSMIQHWNRRILTPIGRVTVVKSLIIPKINHLFISLPTPRRETILSLNKDIFEFVWNAKCDKIKRSVITQDYQQGGLKMLEMNKFIMSLKCSWLKRLIKGKKSWIDIFEAINGVQIVNKLLDFGDAFISECVIPKNNVFWQDVFNSFLCVIKSFNGSFVKENLPSIPVWYNTNIKVGMKTLFIKSWYEKGVKIISDFLDVDGNLLPHDIFQHRFNMNVCIMQYNSVVSAISRYLKSFLTKNSYQGFITPYIPIYYKSLLLYNKCTNVVYRQLNSCNVIPTSISKWESELVQYGAKICVNDAFNVCFKTTKDTQLQWLQFRLLHRILPVNHYLKKIKVVSSDCCSFCKHEVETIQHVFINCEKVSTIWSNLSLHIYHATSLRLGFNVVNILFGELPMSKNNKVINLIILCSKQYLFTCLKKGKLPCLSGLLSYLFNKYKVEKYIASKNFEMQKFVNTWQPWYSIFDTMIQS
eukprot:XP_019924264.1 PREDICTED: uncharacterized protein LOC109619185 [Crassostrea gigas]